MTGASQCFGLINHCCVFDLSFAKGAKKKARRRVFRADDKKKQEKRALKKRMGNKQR